MKKILMLGVILLLIPLVLSDREDGLVDGVITLPLSQIGTNWSDGTSLDVNHDGKFDYLHIKSYPSNREDAFDVMNKDGTSIFTVDTDKERVLINGEISISDGITFSDLNASRIVATDGSKNLVSQISAQNLRDSIIAESVTGTAGNLVFSISPTINDSIVSGTNTFNLINEASTINFATGADALTIGDDSGTVTIRNPNVHLSGDSAILDFSSITGTKTITTGGTTHLNINPGGNVGIGTSSPSDFKLQVAGDIGPNTDSTYDLGSINKKWDNLYVNTIYGTAEGVIIPDGFIQGGVVFADSGGALDQDTNNFYWNDSTNRLGIGTNVPAAKLHVEDGSILATGTTGSTPVSGAGTRMMWIPDKAAFRAGTVNDGKWDEGSIGDNSFAFGNNVLASGKGSVAIGDTLYSRANYSVSIGYWLGSANNADHSVVLGSLSSSSAEYGIAIGREVQSNAPSSIAMGVKSKTTGERATALGYDTLSSGISSTAMGDSTTASGDYSTAMGETTTAYGDSSTAMGSGTTASGWGSTAMGAGTTASGQVSFAAGRRAKALQDGVFAFSDSTNADFEVDQEDTFGARFSGGYWLMGGNVGIGTTEPTQKLDVNGNLRLRGNEIYDSGNVKRLTLGSTNIFDGNLDLSGNFYISGDIVQESGSFYNVSTLSLNGSLNVPFTTTLAGGIDGNNANRLLISNTGIISRPGADAVVIDDNLTVEKISYLGNVRIDTNTIDTTTGNLNINANSNTINIAPGTAEKTVNIATGGTNTKTITIGSTSAASEINQRVGTGGFSLDGVGSSDYDIGASTTTGTIDIGGTSQTGKITIGRSSLSQTLDFGTTGVSTVNIGSSTGAASTTIKSGTGDITLESTDNIILSSTNNVGIGTTNPEHFKLQVNGNVGPNADSTYDLGSENFKWNNLYVDSIHGTVNGTILPDGFSEGGVVFADSDGALDQDINNLYWDDSTNRLGIATNEPSTGLDIGGGTRNHISTSSDNLLVAGDVEIDQNLYVDEDIYLKKEDPKIELNTMRIEKRGTTLVISDV